MGEDVNSCGECTECCRTMGVVEILKPPQVWCQHCEQGKGCGIYADRPRSCAEFTCVWLAYGMSPETRPDRSHVVLIATKDDDLIAKVDPQHPEAHKEPGMKHALRNNIEAGKVIFVVAGEMLTEVQFSSAAVSRTRELDVMKWIRQIEQRSTCT